MMWDLGLSGKRVYCPLIPSGTLVSSHTPKVLEEVEDLYERHGKTFYGSRRSRSDFSNTFGRGHIAFKFSLKPRTAGSVASAAWKAWRDWFGHKEQIRLQRLQQIAEECGKEYTALYFSYLEIRARLREKQKVTPDYYANYLSTSSETVMQMIDLAKESINSCSWRDSPQGGG